LPTYSKKTSSRWLLKKISSTNFLKQLKRQRMKKIIYAAIGIAGVFATACSKKDSSAVKPLVIGTTVDTLVGEITVNTTVTRTTYLKGIVFVKPGITLTINQGVTIKGSLGAAAPDLVNLENNKGTLVVEKGGILNAVGIPTAPIVWTSANPAGSRNFGDWGGVVILGNAPITTSTGANTQIYEAFRTGTPDARFSYGGANATENSGTIAYNRIEFSGGVVLIANQEVNGLTFGGVGSGTTVHHVEVANCGDDGFEFFGGSVNAHHLLSFGNKDDDFDFDEAYTGALQFIIAFRNDLADASGSEWIESDNNSASADFGPNTKAFIANATLIGPSSLTVRPGVTGTFDGGIYVRRASRLILANSLITGNALTNVVAGTPTTKPSFLLAPTDPEATAIAFNVFQTTSATPVVLDANEGNPITLANDAAILNALVANGNSAVATFNDFKLNTFLVPQAGSPALSGGTPLNSFNPFFVGTTQRGAVLTTDQWTTVGSWISIATN
jgi:hypothetical protein